MINDYFYYFGFIYMVDLLICLYRDFKPLTVEQKKNQEGNKLVIDETTTLADFSRMNEKFDKEEKSQGVAYRVKSMLYSVLGIILYAWAIMGYVYDTPEKYWFLFDALVVTAGWSFIIFLGILASFTMANNMRKTNAQIINSGNVQEKKPLKIPLNKIKNVLQLIAVSYILYHHFLVQ